MCMSMHVCLQGSCAQTQASQQANVDKRKSDQKQANMANVDKHKGHQKEANRLMWTSAEVTRSKPTG